MLTEQEFKECSNIGQMYLRCIRKMPKDEIFQINAEDDTTETYGSVMSRSIGLARALTRAGFAPGDVLLLAGHSHSEVHIPYYSAMMCGLPVAAMDPTFKYEEIKHLCSIVKPKVAFVQQNIVKDCERVAKELGITDCKIISFDGEFDMKKFVETYDDPQANDDEYEPPTFDPNTIAWLLSTSGTTGSPKVASLPHRSCLFTTYMTSILFPGEKKIFMNLTFTYWMGSYVNALWSLLMGSKILQTPRNDDTEHLIDVINKYKPSILYSTPSHLRSILKSEKPCDWSCFDYVIFAGEKLQKTCFEQMKTLVRPDTRLVVAYGQTEASGLLLRMNVDGPDGSCGTRLPYVELKLVDPVTGKEVAEPHVPGEAWIKGKYFFAGYYNNPEETAKVYSPDGWLKTGDLLYRDEEDNFYFVDRIKSMFKYKTHNISATELESVILRHPGVLEAGVAGVPHPEDGEWIAALVVPKPGYIVTEQEIFDLVADTLTDKKKLRGGVFLVDALPKTRTRKVARAKLQQKLTRLYNLRKMNGDTSEIL